MADPRDRTGQIYPLSDTARSRSGGLLLLGLLILSCVALVASAFSFDNRLREVRDADTDNQGWIVSQLEVDHLALSVASADALTSAVSNGGRVTPEVWRDLNTEFDIFYSRISVFSAAMRNFEVSPEIEQRLAALMNARTSMADQIDALSPDDLSGLRQLDATIRAQTELVRALVTNGLQFFVSQAQSAREREREIWRFFLTETLVLLALILSAALLSVRLNRALERRTVEAERAASTIVKAYEANLSAVIVMTLDGRVLLFNKTAERMFGIHAEDIIGTIAHEQLAPERLRPIVKATYDKLGRPQPRTRPVMISRRTLAQRSNGEIFPVELSVTNDVDNEGRKILIAFARDISAQVKAENGLRAALDEARRAAAAKSMFLATMSHEMRTPLHGLIAALELMDKTGFDTENRSLFNTALHCSERALSQVNDVLEFTRATSTREVPVPFRPARIARELVDELRPFAQDQGNLIELSITGPGADEQVMGYPAAFSRALYNLVGNAVKFTQSGQITIHLDFSDTPHDAPVSLRVAVEDEGPGIATADQDRIFHLFETSVERVGGAVVGNGQTGTGLGLPITKLAVECMGSQIHLESVLGEGSRFWFDLDLPRIDDADAEPVPPQTLPATATTEPPPHEPWDVLVVDDNEVNLTLMIRMVERLGHRTASARNGREAVDLAAAKAFDVILMDVNMPVMDGRDATREIRRGGASQGAVILGVTALMEAEDPDSFAEFGMDSALVKPVRPDTLAQALAGIAQDRTDDGNAHIIDDSDPFDDDFEAGGLDLAGLAALVGDDTARRLVSATLDDARAAHAALAAAAPDTGSLAHKAAGSASMVGWRGLGAALSDIERLAERGGPDAAQVRLAALDRLIAAAQAELPADSEACVDQSA